MWHTWEGRNVYRFWWENPKEGAHLKHHGIERRVGSKQTLQRLDGGWGGEWILLAQERHHWRSLLNAVMKLRVLAPRTELELVPKLITQLITEEIEKLVNR
jgi:hypothetical protein